MAVSLFSALALAKPDAARGCGDGGDKNYIASDIDIYRIMNYWEETKYSIAKRSFVEDNCRLWQAETGGRVPLAEIRKAIYDMSLDEWRAIRKKLETGSVESKNLFIRHLLTSRDTAAIELLCWSKCYEEIRCKMNSPWYYSCSTPESLGEIADSALSRLGGRYTARYLFLAVKALYALDSDAEAIRLWKKWAPLTEHNALYDQTEGYIAGCLKGLGHREEAMRIFVRQGDIESLHFTGRSMSEVCRMIFEQSPNSDYFAPELQKMLFDLENYNVYHDATWTEMDEDDVAEMLKLAKRACRDRRVKDKALWGYTAAALLDRKGKGKEALRYLDIAEKNCDDGFLANSVRVLRFYIHAKNDPIDARYEAMVCRELKWMENVMDEELAALGKERGTLSNIFNLYYCTHRTVYMHDAIRKILLGKGGVCRRMHDAGRDIRALQLANLAENILFQHLKDGFIARLRKGEKMYCEDEWIVADTPCFRATLYYKVRPKPTKNGDKPELFNSHDYSNELFLLADKLPADSIIAFWRRTEDGNSYADRFLNERGYTDRDYWFDIIGTHLLRDMRYSEAEKWLELVSPGYCQRLNVTFDYEPFSYTTKAAVKGHGSRLYFASQMARYSQLMRFSPDENTRADAMLQYSIGLRNSTDACWTLTAYGRTSWWDEDEEYEDYISFYSDGDFDEMYVSSRERCWMNTRAYRKRALALADSLQEAALRTYTDDEAAAQAYHLLFQNKTVLDRYPLTEAAADILRHCDCWRDYIVGRDAATGSRVPFASHRRQRASAGLWIDRFYNRPIH